MARAPDSSLRWIATLAGGAALISFAPVFVQVADVGPASAGFYRVAIGGLVLAGLAVRRRRWRPERRSMALAAGAGLLFALDLVLWHASILSVGPGLATILANFQVFILAAVGVLVFREPVHLRLVASVPVAVVGLFLLVGLDWSQRSDVAQAGVILGLLAAVAYAGFLLVLRATQRLPGADPMATLAIICLLAAVLLVPLALREPQGLRVGTPVTAVVLLGYALVAQVVAWLLIASALPHVRAGQAGLLLLLQPTLAFIWDMTFFGRPTDLQDIAGALLALAAIYLGTVRRASPPRKGRRRA